MGWRGGYKYKGRTYPFKKWRDTDKSWDKTFGRRRRKRKKHGCVSLLIPPLLFGICLLAMKLLTAI